VTGSSAIGLSRVTIVAPHRRVDLGLPSDVPLAQLLPAVLGLAGDGLADDPEARYGWSLTRPAGTPLDIARSLDDLSVRDGELLFLRPRAEEVPEPVFDDAADAVADASRSLPGRWTPAGTRLFGVWLIALSLIGGAAVLAPAGQAFIGLAAAIVLAMAGMMVARVNGDGPLGAALALPATAYAFVGGLRVLTGDRITVAHVVLGSVAALLVAVVGTLVVAGSARAFLGTDTVAAALTAGGIIALGTGVTGAAAIVAGLAALALFLVPALAARLSQLPQPPTEVGAGEPADEEPLDGARVYRRVAIAQEVVSGLFIGLAVVTVAAAIVLAVDGAGAALAVAAVAGVLLLSRARSFTRVDQRLPLLCGGLLAVVAAATGALAGAGPAARIAVPLALLCLPLAAGFVALRRIRRPAVSPVWGRLTDLAEIMLLVAVVPLLVWVTGLVGWVRSVAG
jgi:type VII secretion integral membrane protein EccD